MAIPFDGTVIGSDGARYDFGDGEMPVDPVPLAGGTAGLRARVDAVEGRVEDLEGRVEVLED